MFLPQAGHIGFDGGETFWSNNVWMRRYRPIRKLLDGLVYVLDKSPAHERAAIPVSRIDESGLPEVAPLSSESASISSIWVNFSLGLPFGFP